MPTAMKTPDVYAALPTVKNSVWQCNVYTKGVKQVYCGSASTIFTVWFNRFNCNDIFGTPNRGKK